MTQPIATFSPLSDAELIEAFRAGDHGAYGVLWERHHHAATRAAAAATSRVDAEDIASEAFVNVMEAMLRGKGPKLAFRPYLLVAVRNTATTLGKASAAVVALDAEESTQLVAPQSTEAATNEELERSILLKGFATLQPRWQEVLWYSDVENLPAQQIAALMGGGMNASAVTSLASRAREGLRDAWIRAHLADCGPKSECSWVIDKLPAYQRGKGRRSDALRVRHHLKDCDYCPLALEEAAAASRRFLPGVAASLLGLGVTGALLASFANPATAHAETIPASRPGWTRRVARTVSRAHSSTPMFAGTSVVVLCAALFGAGYAAQSASVNATSSRDAVRSTSATATPLVPPHSVKSPQSVPQTRPPVPVPSPAPASPALPAAPATAPSTAAPARPVNRSYTLSVSGVVDVALTKAAPATLPSSTKSSNGDGGATSHAASTGDTPPPASRGAADVTPPGAPTIVSVDTASGLVFPVVRGRGAPGATVTVAGPDDQKTVTTVGADGTFTAPPLTGLPVGSSTITAAQTVAGVTSSATSSEVTLEGMTVEFEFSHNGDGDSKSVSAIQLSGAPDATIVMAGNDGPTLTAETDQSGNATVPLTTDWRPATVQYSTADGRTGPAIPVPGPCADTGALGH